MTNIVFNYTNYRGIRVSRYIYKGVGVTYRARVGSKFGGALWKEIWNEWKKEKTIKDGKDSIKKDDRKILYDSLRSKYGLESKKRNAKRYRNTPKGRAALRNQGHKRRVQKRIVESDINLSWLVKLYKNTTKCPMCGIALSENKEDYPRNKHLDHIIPLIVGGLHIKSNVRIICAHCNLTRPKDGSDIPRFPIMVVQ